MKLEGYEYQSDFARKYVAEGRAVGRAEGEDGLRGAIRTLCEALGLDWSDARAAQIATLDARALTTLHATLARDRAWPA